jgi:hypothetical protein
MRAALMTFERQVGSVGGHFHCSALGIIDSALAIVAAWSDELYSLPEFRRRERKCGKPS